MKDVLAPLRNRFTDIAINLIIIGIVLLIMAVLVVWTDFVLELLIGIIIIVLAYIMFYGAYKLWKIRNMLK
ncbi:MAG: hypothetical protein V1865_00220 [bacterium]